VVLYELRYTIGLKKLAPLFHPIKSKTKTNRDLLAHVFPRFAWSFDWFSSLSVAFFLRFAWSSDWFSKLSVAFVIDQSDYFGFTVLHSNPLYKCNDNGCLPHRIFVVFKV